MKKILTLTVLCSMLLMATDSYGQRRQKERQPEFSAKSYVVADSDGVVYREHDSNSVRPIASITKLMVALLAVEQDLDELLPIPNKREYKTVIPRKTKELSRKELLTLSLVKSDNLASDILCNHIPDCLYQMNLRAYAIGMLDTKFTDATGLDNGNVSTASDLLKLVMVSHNYPIIAGLSSLPEAQIESDKKPLKIRNTNPLTWKHRITLSKTGFTRAAGGCIIMVVDSEAGRRYLVLLGSRNVRTRVPDMEKLLREI